MKKILLLISLLLICTTVIGMEILEDDKPQASRTNFPGGYIDSPMVTKDESALYFLHSPISAIELISDKMKKKQMVKPLSGHQGLNGKLWWNTDLYVSYNNRVVVGVHLRI